MDDHTRDIQEDQDLKSSEGKENYNAVIGKEKATRIWDRIDVETKTDDVLGATRENKKKFPDEMTNESKNLSSNLKRKVQVLVKENNEKELKVRELKTLLGRKKFSNERKLKKLEEEWKGRLEGQSLQFEKSKKELNDLIAKVTSSCSDLTSKKDNLSAQIDRTQKRRAKLCLEMKEKGRNKTQLEENKWKRDEMVQFKKLAKGKMSLIKKEAATALEPELRKIVEAHKEKLVKIRDQKDMALKLMVQTLGCETEKRFKKEVETFDGEEERLLARMDRDYEKRIRRTKNHHLQMLDQLRTTHADNVKVGETTSNSKKASAKIEYELKLSQEKRANETEVNQVREALRREESEAIETVERELACKETQIERDFTDWKATRRPKIESELDEEQRKEIEGIENKAGGDVKVITAKLETEFEEKKANMFRRKKMDANDFESLKATEMEKYLEQRDKLRKELEVSRQEEEQLKKISSHLKQKLLNFQQKAASSEKSLMECKRYSTELQHSCLQQKQKAEYDAHIEIKLSNEEIETLKHQHNDLTMKCENLRLEMKKKILRLRETNQKEMQYSRNKIRVIIEKKETDLAEKRMTLSKLKNTIAEKEDDLNQRRKNQLLGLNPQD